ncbi:hypothetical protein, partial [Pseudomonas lundensis]|uniref:hypothetical protein n=1 Tax=Pseudomonas lundensis TaxID=86185 RepID=UPI001CA41B9D
HETPPKISKRAPTLRQKIKAQGGRSEAFRQATLCRRVTSLRSKKWERIDSRFEKADIAGSEDASLLR